MRDREFIGICLKAIEEKIQWGPSEQWTKGDFERLSETISSQSGILISSMTLMRLFGKTKTHHEQYTPQYETKNALARYLGFSSWQHFVDHHISGSVNHSKFVFSRRFRFFLLFFSFFIILLTGYFLFPHLPAFVHYNFRFEIIDSAGASPHKAAIQYDISEITDSVWVDFGNHDRRFLSPFFNRYNYSYTIPGYYILKLLVHNKVIACRAVHVFSDKWNCVFMNVGGKKEFLSEEMIVSSGRLHLDPVVAGLKYQVDTDKDIEYFYALPIRISGDSMFLETQVKNPGAEGGIPYFDFKLRIFCEHGEIYLHFSKPGCLGWVDFIVSDKVIEGSHEDMSVFGREFSDWRRIGLKITDKNVSVVFDQQQIFTTRYSVLLGDVKVIRLIFRGFGSADYIRISRSGSDTLFYDDFNRL